MKKPNLFSASFEESLNLQDDAFYQMANKTYEKAIVTNPNGWTTGNALSMFILSLIGVGMNFLLVLFVNHIFHHADPKDVTLPLSYNFLPYWLYWLFFAIWLSFIVIGRLFFTQKFLFIYRTHFHTQVIYLIWLIIEVNLFFLTAGYASLTIWGVLLFFILTAFLGYLIVRSRLTSLTELIYSENIEKTNIDKLIDNIFKWLLKYGWGLVALGLLARYLMPSREVRTDWIGALGILAMWFAVNIAIIAAEVYLFFPYFLQAYYKLKYPEDYRNWEGKSIEEWYGEKYLKKHPNLTIKGENNE